MGNRQGRSMAGHGLITNAIICGLGASLFLGAAQAQVTRADYDRALGMQEKLRGLVEHAPDSPEWIEGTSHFIYRRSTIAANGHPAGQEYIWVDAETGGARPAFDHAKLAEALSHAFGAPVKPEALPLGNYHVVDHEAAIEVLHANAIWRCDLSAYTCAKKRDLT